MVERDEDTLIERILLEMHGSQVGGTNNDQDRDCDAEHGTDFPGRQRRQTVRQRLDSECYAG
jgi:hypothetical protein